MAKQSVADRIRFVKESGRVASYDAWAKAAGLSRQYLTSYLERDARHCAGELPNRPTIGTDAGFSLAKAARVPWAWLLVGVGKADDTTDPEFEANFRYPSRVGVLEDDAYKSRWSRPARAAIRRVDLEPDEDPGEAWWIEALDRIDAAIKVALPPLHTKKYLPTSVVEATLSDSASARPAPPLEKRLPGSQARRSR